METKYCDMETDYCDICDGKCLVYHGKNQTNHKEKRIQQIIHMLMSYYDDNMIDEIIKRIYEIRQLKKT